MTEDSRTARSTGTASPEAVPAGPRPLSAAEVDGYLKAHPDFLAQHPHLANVLTPPTRDNGDGVVDLQYFLVQRQRGDIARLAEQHRQLSTTVRANAANQARAHEAVLAMMSANSFEHLIEIVTSDLAIMLNVDAVALCVETNGFLLAGDRMAGVRILAEGSIDELMGSGQPVRLRNDIEGDPEVFGGLASLIRSDAMVRLHFSSKAPNGLLVLGARDPDAFYPGLGTELLLFLSRALAGCVRLWLDLPADE